MILDEQAKGLLPNIYSWKINPNDILLCSKGELTWGTHTIPTWVDNDPRTTRIWLEYSIAECASCAEKLYDKLNDKGSHASNKCEDNISFESLDVIQAANAYKLIVEVNVKASSNRVQLTPHSEKKIEIIKDKAGATTWGRISYPCNEKTKFSL